MQPAGIEPSALVSLPPVSGLDARADTMSERTNPRVVRGRAIGYVTGAAHMSAQHAGPSERAIERICQRDGWELADIVHDRDSGGVLEGSELSRALQRIDDGEARALVVTDARTARPRRRARRRHGPTRRRPRPRSWPSTSASTPQPPTAAASPAPSSPSAVGAAHATAPQHQPTAHHPRQSHRTTTRHPPPPTTPPRRKGSSARRICVGARPRNVSPRPGRLPTSLIALAGSARLRRPRAVRR